MKKYTFLFIVALIITGCEKEAKEIDAGYPVVYELYFELLNDEGKEIPDNQIAISHRMTMHNGHLEVFGFNTDQPDPEQQWFNMGVISSPEEVMEKIRAENKVIYGQSYKDDPFQRLIYESGERHKWVLEGLDEPVRDWYYLFKNVNDHSKVDTLRIRDVVLPKETYERTFDFFWNEEPVEYRVLDDSGYAFEGYVTPLRVKE